MNFLAFSNTVWDGLRADQQANVMKAAQDATASITASIVENEAQLVALLRAKAQAVASTRGPQY